LEKSISPWTGDSTLRIEQLELARKLEMTFGGTWTGISFLDQEPADREERNSHDGIRFCEAVRLARVSPVLFHPEKSACLGAQYAFGHLGNSKDKLIENLVNAKGFSGDYAGEILNGSPHLLVPAKAVGLNLKAKSDVLLAALQPKQAMFLVQTYQLFMEKPCLQEMSSVLSICSNVAVKARNTQDLVVSFGCEDSRNFGRFTRDRLFAGLPNTLGWGLVNARARIRRSGAQE
jgi:uncharacterized protein (DUF169 family)